ncbi:MAG: hypothetical protein HFH14_06510 [Lachnospiraceae bacterium]|nr:hypothetical protein [Lachnospiraceae bacterium]
MKRIMKRAASLVLATALVVTGVYCGGTDAQAAKKPKKITMNKKNVNVTVGGKYTLKVKKVTPKKASKAVTYKTSNKKIATISKKGVIKGKKVGKATITVTAKANKKVKTKVKVTVKKADTPVITTAPAPVVGTPTPVVTSAPNPTNVPDSTNAPTSAPTPTPTKRPVKTPVPSTPTPVPTPPAEMLDHGSAPHTLEFNEETVVTQGAGGSYVINDDGSITISVNEQYCGVGFQTPIDLKENNFDTVTITYKDATNVGSGYGSGLWRDRDNKDTEDVIDWAGVFGQTDEDGNPITSGEYVASIADRPEGTNAWYVNKILLFHNDTSVHGMTPSASVTITKVVFSHSKYVAGTETPSPKPEPTPDFAATKISTPVTVDGTADDVWADVPELPVSSRVLCDNKGESDTTASAKIAWDENNLYGLVKVMDANIDAAAEVDHQRDGVEFFLDEDYSMDKDYAVNTDAFQYRLTGLTKNEDGTAKDALTNEIKGGSDAAKEDYKGVETAYSFVEGGYVVEFKIPFKEAKEAGDLVGFDVIVQDCKDGKRDAEIYLRNTDKEFSYWNLGDVFGTLKLVDDSTPSVPSVGNELITNGDFNDGTTGWLSNYAADAISVAEVDGDNVLKVSGRWNQFSGAKRLMSGDFKKGDKVTVKLDAFTEDTAGTSCTVIFCYNGEEKTEMNKEINVAEWNRALEYEYILAEDTTELDMQIRIQDFANKWNGEANKDFCLDNVSVIHTPAAE